MATALSILNHMINSVVSQLDEAKEKKATDSRLLQTAQDRLEDAQTSIDAYNLLCTLTDDLDFLREFSHNRDFNARTARHVTGNVESYSDYVEKDDKLIAGLEDELKRLYALRNKLKETL